ncbi:DNA-binding protein [uncultured archaeon]|nr:DNA-binding protein [uncultured archaeon]
MVNEESEEQARMKKAVYKKLKEMQIEQQKKAIAQRLMTPEAYERLMNVRVANRELFTQLLEVIIAMAQQNRTVGKITEEQLRDILSRLTYRPESKIEFKHK